MIFGTALATSMSFGLIGIADVFVPFFYGEGYVKCVELFYILLPSCIFLAIANVIRTQFLIPHSMDKEFTVSLVLGACVNLIINITFIPKLQSVGAAVGTLIAEATVCFIQGYFVKDKIELKKYAREILYIFISGLLMAIAVYFMPFIRNYLLTLCMKIVVGCVVFGILMIYRYKDFFHQLIIHR